MIELKGLAAVGVCDEINYLFHIMANDPPIPLPGDHVMWQVCYSALDETDGTYDWDRSGCLLFLFEKA